MFRKSVVGASACLFKCVFNPICKMYSLLVMVGVIKLPPPLPHHPQQIHIRLSVKIGQEVIERRDTFITIHYENECHLRYCEVLLRMVRQARNGMKGKIYYILDFSTIKKGEISLYNQLYVGEIYYIAIVVQLGGGALHIIVFRGKDCKG